MLKDISIIDIQGGRFITATKLPILKSTNSSFAKVSILYGRNGSGKSTIAKAFRKIKGEAITTHTHTEVLNNEAQPVTLSDEDRARIFVFDEDFVTNNVRIEGRGLGSIVMLGEQADLTAQIEQAEIELAKAEKKFKMSADLLQEYQTETNPKAPKFYNKKIYKVLQNDEGWAGRERKIQSARKNSSVNDETYKKIVALHPHKSKSELFRDFDDKMKKLEIAKSGAAKIDKVVPTIPETYKRYSVAFANSLIKEKIEKPELSKREQYLLSMIEDGMTDELEKIKNTISNEQISMCPYCLQEINKNYRNTLISEINKVLTDKVKNHQKQLQDQKISELILDISHCEVLSSHKNCIDLIMEINRIITTNNTILQSKIDDPFSQISDNKLYEIDKLKTDLKITLDKLEDERQLYNNNAANTQLIIDELLLINNDIAYYEIIDLAEQLEKQNLEMLDIQSEHNIILANREEKKQILIDLNARRERIDIAIDVINNSLKYIFFDEQRLAIVCEENLYKILSNGQPVEPKNISVGERNIIGLCYFFASILTGKNKNTAYNEEYIIVIDDPISSYDFENKVGIMSFLKYKLCQFLNGNENSKAVIMTHDLLTLFDLEKICKELNDNWIQIFGRSYKANIWELKQCSLNKFNIDCRYEYTELINLIYEYGNGGAAEHNMSIGNIMRQVLEAFTTFEYKKRIDNVSTDDNIINNLNDEYKIYFKNLMYRLVLNNGSHRKEQVQSMDFDFFSVISESEKRRTAKEIICFMYLLNEKHILSHLGGITNSDVSNTINNWCNEIENRSAII